MEQFNKGVALLGDTVRYGLKHMLPECFVSVKLETYEESSCSESQKYNCNASNFLSASVSVTLEDKSEVSTPSTRPLSLKCCNQVHSSCKCSAFKKNCIVSRSSSSPQGVYQYEEPSAPIMQHQQQPQSNGQPSQQQATSQAQAIVRSGAAAHSFPHPHPRASTEISWLSHSYSSDQVPVAITAVSQGSQHFHSSQVPYLQHEATLLPAEGVRIIKPCNSSTTNPPCTPGASGLVGLPAVSEVGDSNTFINYVLNQQRAGVGVPTGSIFLFDPSRGLTSHSSHHVQQINGESVTGRPEDSDSHAPDQSLEDVPRNATPEAASSSGSPKPAESHLVSRYCQTVVTMSQIQDSPLMPDAKIIITVPPAELATEPEDSKDKVFETDGEEQTNIPSMTMNNQSKNHKRIGSRTHYPQRGGNFESQRPALNCHGNLNNVNPCIGTCRGDGECVGRCHECREIPKSSQAQGVISHLKPETSSSSKISSDGKLSSSGFPYLDIDRPFRCDICGKTYPTQQALLSHDRYHRGERPYECETCHKAFATNSHLVTHRRTHTGERPFQCQLCHRCFADRSAFVKHERTHGPNGAIIKRYKCEECGNGFVDSCGLKKHTRIHTGERPYICTVCEKSFSTSSTFVAHKRIHTGERPYKCESCDKMFITKSHLLTHRRTHTGEKPFTCSVCNRCFADGSSFRRHERLHTGENRHICDLCGRGFPLESSLEKHKQTHVQSNNFSYMYEGRSDLNCVTVQQQQSCEIQANRTGSVIPVTQVREHQSDRNLCVDLSREMSGEVQVNRSNLCAVASRDIECDNQNNRNNIMVPAREIA